MFEQQDPFGQGEVKLLDMPACMVHVKLSSPCFPILICQEYAQAVGAICQYYVHAVGANWPSIPFTPNVDHI